MKRLSRIKRGITLIELVVSIAISTIVFIGVTGVMLFLRSENTKMREDVSKFFIANTLCHAIEKEIDENNGVFTYVSENYENNDPSRENNSGLIDMNTEKLFSTADRDYYFVSQHFGYCNKGHIDKFNDIYFTNSDIELSFKNVAQSNIYELVLSYDYKETQQIRLSKSIVKNVEA